MTSAPAHAAAQPHAAPAPLPARTGRTRPGPATRPVQLTEQGDERHDQHGVSEQATSVLQRVKRDLSASLALSAPGSPVQVPILRQLNAISTELSRRPGGQG